MEGCTKKNGEYLVQMSVHVAFLKICFELIDANQIYMLDAFGKFEALLINKNGLSLLTSPKKLRSAHMFHYDVKLRHLFTTTILKFSIEKLPKFRLTQNT